MGQNDAKFYVVLRHLTCAKICLIELGKAESSNSITCRPVITTPTPADSSMRIDMEAPVRAFLAIICLLIATIIRLCYVILKD